MSVVAFSISLAGCGSREDRLRGAFEQYQAAAAAGDLAAARTALQLLVAEDDSVAEYWVELGETHLALSDFGGSYNAFLRAHELDRANPKILAALTQLALRSGKLQLAEQHARQLELVAPDDAAVRLTHGYVALRREDIAEADEHVTRLLAAAPYDPSAKVLRSRILLQSGKPDEAIVLLRHQIALQPSDEMSLLALLGIYESRDEWRDAAATARSLMKWRPKDQELRARLIEDELRAGEVQAALAHTASGLATVDARRIEQRFAPWIATGQQHVIAMQAFEAGKKVRGERRLAIARFLASAGKPDAVLALTRDLATMPVTPANLAANALFGAALSQARQPTVGLERLNAVLALDAGNSDALRGRAELRSRAGDHRQAVEDARKLISASRGSAQGRLLLARIYIAASQSEDAKRTLWEAFHEIPADHAIYDALRSIIAKSGDPHAVNRLAEEFEDQRNIAMTRDFA